MKSLTFFLFGFFFPFFSLPLSFFSFSLFLFFYFLPISNYYLLNLFYFHFFSLTYFPSFLLHSLPPSLPLPLFLLPSLLPLLPPPLLPPPILPPPFQFSTLSIMTSVPHRPVTSMRGVGNFLESFLLSIYDLW